MKVRVVKIIDGSWRITTGLSKLRDEEIAELQVYLDEIRFPYELDKDGIRIHTSISKSDIEERILHFYDGPAVVFLL